MFFYETYYKMVSFFLILIKFNMNKYFCVLFTFFIGVLTFFALKVEAVMPLTGKTIVIDPGHGGIGVSQI